MSYLLDGESHRFACAGANRDCDGERWTRRDAARYLHIAPWISPGAYDLVKSTNNQNNFRYLIGTVYQFHS